MADIGLDDDSTDAQLVMWFALAESWNAILLLDEADIFLEKRQKADIKRNGLVSGEKFPFEVAYHTDTQYPSFSAQDGILPRTFVPHNQPDWPNR